MQIKIALDETLIRRAQEITGIESKDEAVREALRALISIREQTISDDAQPQEEVIRSLEHSLDENRDIWSELAKH